MRVRDCLEQIPEAHELSRDSLETIQALLDGYKCSFDEHLLLLEELDTKGLCREEVWLIENWEQHRNLDFEIPVDSEDY
jgi:predicted SAM-dependent methyltransferase